MTENAGLKFTERNRSVNLCPRRTKEFWERVEKTAVCWNWIGGEWGGGYGFIWVNYKKIAAHRVSWILHNGDIPNKKCVCHSCDNRKCVNPSHLWLGTSEENTKDRFIKGRSASGARNGVFTKPENYPNRKLDEIKVREIRRLHNSGKRGVEIAKQFNVSTAIISTVVNFKQWVHIN